MIAANELRIGNCIEFPFIGANVEVIGIAVKDDSEVFIQTKLNSNTFFELPIKYKPIQLTEDWLVRFGLVKRNGYPHELMDGYIKIRNGVYFFKYYKLEVELPFVHTLQNFYFSTKGKELELKPEI